MRSTEEMKVFFDSMRFYLKSHKENIELNDNQITNILRNYDSTDSSYNEDLISEKCNQAIEYTKYKNIHTVCKSQGIFTYVVFNLYGPEDYRKITKLYFNVNYDKIDEVLYQIYLYIINNNIRCETKVSSKDRSDNFVIRLYDIKDLEPFLEFCNSNEIIKSNLKKQNPFIACKNNIGVVQDGYTKDSFNGALSKCLANFINGCNKFGELHNMDIIHFQEYLIEVINETEDEELKFNYLCIFNSINQMVENLDPVSEIRRNIENETYNF